MKGIPDEQQAKLWSVGEGKEENRALLQRIQLRNTK